MAWDPAKYNGWEELGILDTKVDDLLCGPEEAVRKSAIRALAANGASAIAEASPGPLIKSQQLPRGS